MKFQNTAQTIVTLANGAELVAQIAEKVLGGDVADTVEGTPLNKGAITNLAMARFQMNLQTYRGKANA